MLDVAYLATGLVLAGHTLHLWRPRAFGSVLGAVMAGPNIVLAAFAPHAVAISAGLALAAAAAGVMGSWAGLAGLAVRAFCWAGLVLHVVRVHRTRPVLEGRVIEDHGPPLGEGSLAPPPAEVGRSWLSLALFRVPQMAEVEVTLGVPYREVDGVELRLDVYLPRRREGPLPAIVYLHGGAWVTGSRRQSRFLLSRFAAAGWAVFAASYRRAPRFPLPAAIVDAKAALAWVRGNAGRYGVDQAKLVAFGESAGGHLAAMLALTANRPELQPGFEEEDTRVQGAMIHYGVSDLVSAFERGGHPAMVFLLERLVLRRPYATSAALYRELQPLSHAKEGAPPMLLVHGNCDTMVPVEMSRELCARLRAAGSSAHLVEVPGMNHAFEVIPTPLQERVARVSLAFLERVQERASG